MLVHVTTETCRHAGHADLARELVDGKAGYATWAATYPDTTTRVAAHGDRVEDEASRAG